MGDSGSFIATARVGWIPGDRSWAYGFVVRALALWWHSLTPLILVQVSATAVVAFTVCYVLYRRLAVRPGIVVVVGPLVALDPLEIYVERLVMTEGLTVLFFALLIAVTIGLGRRLTIGGLIAVQLLSLFVVALRTSLVPVLFVLTASVAVWALFGAPQGPHDQRFPSSWSPLARRLAIAFGSLSLSLILMLSLHAGYRWVTGHLAKTEPAYLPDSGLFLLGLVSPVVQPGDAGEARLREILDQPEIPLTWDYRNAQVFSQKGLVSRLLAVEPTRAEANRVAKAAALHTLRRDPLGVLGLGVETYHEFLARPLTVTLSNDDNLQLGLSFSPSFSSVLAEGFHFSGGPDWPQEKTAAKRYLLLGRGWLYVLLLSPWLGLVPVLFASSPWRRWVAAFLALSSFVILASHLVFAPCVARYLLPVSVLTWILVGLTADELARLLGARLRPSRLATRRVPPGRQGARPAR